MTQPTDEARRAATLCFAWAQQHVGCNAVTPDELGEIALLIDQATGLPALKVERDRLQLVASNAHEHTAILRERVTDLELALRAVMAHGVTHAIGCSHHDATCSCHKALARQALSNTKEP